MRIVTASEGQEALALARSLYPAAITLDVLMPGMDGWEVLRELKATPETHDIPVIGVTAHAMTGDREKALAAGCDDYVTKPVDLPQLLGKLDQLLTGAKARKP